VSWVEKLPRADFRWTDWSLSFIWMHLFLSLGARLLQKISLLVSVGTLILKSMGIPSLALTCIPSASYEILEGPGDHIFRSKFTVAMDLKGRQSLNPWYVNISLYIYIYIYFKTYKTKTQNRWSPSKARIKLPGSTTSIVNRKRDMEIWCGVEELQDCAIWSLLRLMEGE